jgi:acyl carrier protein
MDKEIVSRVNELMHQGFEIPLEQLVPGARLKEDLALDSLDAVDMLVHLEEKLGARIEGERLMQVKTLGDVYVLVTEAMQAQNSEKTTEINA